jgi:hypothetical protein
MLCHLSEVELRGVYLRHAYASMHDYCVAELHMSDSEAYFRIRVARLSRQFPVVLEMLAKGEGHLSALQVLAPVMTPENSSQLLAGSRFATKLDVQRLVCSVAPKSDVKNEIGKLPGTPQVKETQPEQQPLREPAPSSTTQGHQPPSPLSHAAVKAPHAEVPSSALHEQTPSSASPSTLAPAVASPRTRAPAMTPLRQDRYKVQFTADEQLHDKLKTAQQFMRHQIPDGDIAKVVDRALDLLIAQQRKQHFGATDNPRAPRAQTAKLSTPATDQTSKAHAQIAEPPTSAADQTSAAQKQAAKRPNPDSRHIPNEVKRQVLARDGERCSYVSPKCYRAA